MDLRLGTTARWSVDKVTLNVPVFAGGSQPDAPAHEQLRYASTLTLRAKWQAQARTGRAVDLTEDLQRATGIAGRLDLVDSDKRIAGR